LLDGLFLFLGWKERDPVCIQMAKELNACDFAYDVCGRQTHCQLAERGFSLFAETLGARISLGLIADSRL
jgi:hypothetical protein